MKRRDLVRTLEEMGCAPTRHGGKHDWVHESEDQTVSTRSAAQRINEQLAKSIIKKLKSQS